MKLNAKLSKKEKREIAFILGSVLLVAIVGVSLTWLVPQSKTEAVSGLAVDSSYPTYAGVLSVLEDSCSWVESSGSDCDSVCSGLGDVCLPLEETCSVEFDGMCRCCEVPE